MQGEGFRRNDPRKPAIAAADSAVFLAFPGFSFLVNRFTRKAKITAMFFPAPGMVKKF
ncbi:hypothetical protein [Ewingella americana]|uniref:hypothetical protein n=1 Tax=Ewingella americana TaxID=41202 RepID=UPI0013867F3B|nr:hypothetical protein [Ewingella americana]